MTYEEIFRATSSWNNDQMDELAFKNYFSATVLFQDSAVDNVSRLHEWLTKIRWKSNGMIFSFFTI